MEKVPAAHLRKVPDTFLEATEKDGLSTIYDDLLTQLQIRPESCRLFFERNLRPYRNKKHISKLIMRGTDLSLRELSDSFLSAFGGLVWAKNRGWLLRADELQPGQKPLRYHFPKDRQAGDHEVFYSVLKKLWQRMRVAMYELKKSYRDSDHDAAQSLTDSAPSPIEPESLPSDTEATTHLDIDMLDTSTHNLQVNTEFQRQRSINEKKKQYIRNRTRDGTRPRYYAPPPPPNEVTPPGFWPASRTQEAIMNIIEDLHTTRMHSHPQVFEAAYEESLARLTEWAEQDRLPESSEGATTLAREKEGQTSDHLNTYEQQPVDMATEAASPNESQINSDAVVNSANPAETSNSSSHATEPRSFTDAHRPYTPLGYPLSIYLPPVLPYTMSISITPFHVPPSSSNVQPFLWPLAPVQPEHYGSFIEGVRLRANVPDSVKSERLVAVLAYGWNDFSRLVRGEEDWRNGVMGDLRDASTRLGVRVWRARCCVFAS